MGCSPSKGKLFSKPQAPGLQIVEVADVSQSGADQQPVEKDDGDLKTDENELPKPTEELSVRETEWSQVALDTKPAQEDVKEMETNAMPQEPIEEVVQAGKVKKTEKRKKNKDKRRRSLGKQRKSSIIQKRVDFPPHMVRAHQAAYAFLNPNISKYETLLSLLDQAAQTQLSLRPMMSALVLRFEEVNQALEEMAEEGELMLKEHGDYMALPSGMLGPAVMPVKPSMDTPNPVDPPLDLLQQLLQHSTEKMRLVGGPVQALGDTTLGDASQYFSSLSKVLVEKLRAKQSAERRLTQVLARVEAAAIRKSNPEDTALHSEDSGIGGENESLTGSERHRRHRGSAGSGSCGSGANIRSALDSLPSLVGHNENDEDEEEEDDDDDDDEEYEDEEEESYGRKRSNSSPPDPSQTLLYLRAKYMQDAAKRPMTAMTAAKAGSSSSDGCVNLVMELQKSQRDLEQRMRKMADIKGNKESAGPQYHFYRAGLRRHSLCSSGGQSGSFKSHKSPGFLPMLAPQPPKRQTVRRLINTFSQGVDGRPGQSLANVPPQIRRPRKSANHQLSDTGNDGVVVVNGNNNNNSWPDSKDDLDVDSLPPPPPEVLMDNSFHVTESLQGNDGREDSTRTLPMINQKAAVSQRLRTCVQNVDVLPNRISMRPKSTLASAAHALKQNGGMGSQESEQQPEVDLDPEMEKANCLFQQAHKIIHLRNAAESADKRNMAHQSSRGPSPLSGRLGHRSESNELHEGEMSACSPPVTAPPVSRVRLPPSGPSIRHRYPSPPVARPPSRPGSPRTVTRASANDRAEIIPSVSFHDARSVFCQKESQNAQSWTPSGSAGVARPWGEASRGRLSTRGTDSSARRTQSEQRPSSHPEEAGSSSTSKANESGTKKRLSGPVVTGDEDQSDTSASVTTA